MNTNPSKMPLTVAMDPGFPRFARARDDGTEIPGAWRHVSHPPDAEGARFQRTDLRLAADRQAEGQHLAAVARIDQSVVPQPRGRVPGHGFGIDSLDDVLLHGFELLALDGPALALELLLGDDRHDFRGLLAAHDGDAIVGPGEDEARIVGAAAHAIIAGPERGADVQRDLRHGRIGDCLDHLRAVLDDAVLLGLAP